MRKYKIALCGFLAIGSILGAGMLAADFFIAGSPPAQLRSPIQQSTSSEITGDRTNPPTDSSSETDASPLYVSLQSVQSLIKRRQDLLLVDVRGEAAFERYRIPGSIRVPLHALKTKAFLKGGWSVLVNDGYPSPLLERTCRELRSAGFARVSILDGGLRYWQQKKGPIEGESWAASDAGRVSAIDFCAHRDSTDWLVITVDTPGAKALRFRNYLPGAIYLPWDGNPATFTSALKAVLAGQARSTMAGVLMCDADGTQYEKIERAVQQEEIGKVFYLEGGMAAYDAFVEQQALLRQPGKEELKRCATCS